MEILQMAVTVDEARQNAFTLDVDHLGAGGNSDVATSAHCRELARLNNNDRIVDRPPAGAID